MDSPSAAPDPLTATLHDAVMHNAGRNEFSITRSYTNAIEYDRVSLENNILDKSSHPLQRIGAPALQGPITPHDGDYTPVSAAVSLSLSRELVERILLLLDATSILKCMLVNNEFNAIVQSSTLVQYHLACDAAGVIDNPQSPLPYAERLGALRKREDAWRKLEPVFETTIKVTDQPSWLYELTAGKYFRSDENEKDIHCCHLPSSPQDNPQWFRIPGHGTVGQSWSGSVVETGMAVYEHDLIVNVISSEAGIQAGIQQYSLDLVLLKFSTGEYHPLARHPLINVQRSPASRPYTILRIVGDNLALAVHWDGEDGSQLFIFDWKTGHKRLHHKASKNAYRVSVPVFVSPELILVPNCILSHFEIWYLFPHPHPNPPVQILSLKVPAVSDNYSITSIDCHGEPSPFLHSMPYFPPQPFFPSSENSIIIVSLLLLSFPGYLQIAYKLILHRRMLLDMIQKLTSPSFLEQQDLPTLLTNKVTVHKVADPEDGSVRLGAQSEFNSMMPHTGPSPRSRDSPTLANSQTSSTSHISADTDSSSISSGSDSSTPPYNILQVRWADWGPPISRWFQVKVPKPWWNNQSTGQRYVFLDPNPHDERKCLVGVADFNLRNVRRHASTTAQLRGEGKDNSSNDNNREAKKEKNEEELEILDHEGVFSEEVYLGLKCSVYHAPREFELDGILIDEQRLLGLKLDADNRVECIKVFYFG